MVCTLGRMGRAPSAPLLHEMASRRQAERSTIRAELSVWFRACSAIIRRGEGTVDRETPRHLPMAMAGAPQVVRSIIRKARYTYSTSKRSITVRVVALEVLI